MQFPLRTKRSVTAALTAAVALILLVGIVVVFKDQLPSIRQADLTFVQNVSAESVLRMDFPEPMDRASVEANLTTDGVKGTVSWEGNTLLFTPERPLKKKSTVYLRVGPNAVTAKGRPTGKSLIFSFAVTGQPFAAARIPAPNSVDVDPTMPVTIVFDRPLVSLGKISDQTKLPTSWQGSISPAVEGTWKWLSTHAVEFTPRQGLTPATVYSVALPAGLEFLDGTKTVSDYSWQFETSRLEVTETTPAAGSNETGATPTMSLVFNYPPNLESVNRHLQLWALSTGSGGERKTPVALQAAKRNGANRNSITVQPTKALAMNAPYRLELTAGTLAEGGNLGTQSGYTVDFSTAAPLSVQGQFEYGGLRLNFNNRLAAGTLKGNVIMTPSPKDWAEMDLTPNQWSDDRELTVYPTLKPSTKYTVRVNKGVRDVHGQSLAAPYEFSFETLALSPQTTLHSRGTFGIWEKGKEAVVYVNSLNNQSVSVTAAKLTWPQLLATWQNHRGSSAVPDFSAAAKKATSTYTPKLGKNLWDVKSIDLEQLLHGEITGGIYGVRVDGTPRNDLGDYERGSERMSDAYYFSYTNLSLTLKFTGSRALLWVTNMQTGAPVSGAVVKFYALNGSNPITVTTDREGFVDTPIKLADFVTNQNDWQPEFFVTAETSDDFAFISSQWNNGLSPGDFSLWSDFQGTGAKAFRPLTYLYTDRGLYKAGDRVEFKGIFRLKDWNGELKLPGTNRQVTVVIQNPSGTEVYREQLPVSDFGSFAGSYQSIANAELGTYSFQLTVTPDDIVNNPIYWAGTFRLAAYRKPEFKVDLESTQADYTDGDTLQVNVNGSYYFGAPLREATYRWTAQSTDYYFNRYTTDDGWYSFALEDAWCYWDCERQTTVLGSGEGTLDAAGRATVRVPLSLKEQAVSQIASVSVEIADTNNQSVTAETSVPVHKSQVYVGIRSDDGVLTPGSEGTARLIALRPDGKPIANQSITMNVLSRTWTTVRKQGVDGEFYYENEPKDTLVTRVTGRTETDGRLALRYSVPGGGEYRLVAETEDGKGNAAVAATSVYAWADTYVNWPRSNNDRIEVVPDKPEYRVGDTAKLLVKSPYQGKGVKALVTVERDSLISKAVIDIKSNAQSIEVPIEEALLPNAFVSVVILKPRQGETYDKQDRDTGAPAVKIGYARLRIDPKAKELDVKVSTDKARYLPGETVRVSVTTKDAAGKPVPAEVSLAAVDLSLLALTGNPLPDLTSEFYSQHGLGVLTAQSLSQLLERFKPGSKGGGGGADGEGGDVRGTFKDTAYWQASVQTGAEGKATLQFTLPDNLTTWQLLAIGHTKQHQFGSEKHEILATKDALVRLVRPRFALVDDTFSLGAIVQNEQEFDDAFTITLTGSGFGALSGTERTARVSKRSQQKVEFPIKILPGTAATFRISVRGKTAKDAVEETIPVDVAVAPQSTATAGNTQGKITERVSVPSKDITPRGTLELRMSPSIISYLPESLSYLTTFPYGCAEQTASSFLPNVILSRMQGYEALRSLPKATLDERVKAGLQRLYTFQSDSGGFRYFESSRETSPYLSAYILFTLEQAAQAGYSVDRGVVSRVNEYLQATLRSQNLDATNDLAVRAYILYVLSELGTADAKLVSALAIKQAQLPVYARAELAMALENVGQSGKAAQVLTALLNDAKIDPRGTHFEEEDTSRTWFAMQTADRTTATVLRAMLRIEPTHPLIPDTLKWLLNARVNGAWSTTQANSTVLLTVLEYVEKSGELKSAEQGTMRVNGTVQLDKRFDPNELNVALTKALTFEELGHGKESTVDIEARGQGRIYYDLVMKYDTTESEPVENGMSISRRITALGNGRPTDLPALDSAKVGETYRVTLTMTVPEERHNVAVESPLPAGMEAIDFSFATAPGARVREAYESQFEWNPWSADSESNALWYFSHREFRDDRVFLFADWLPPGVYTYSYLVRATQPGTFTLRPSRLWEMYFPEVLGQTEGRRFVINP